jgi:hypothetical protein
VGNFQSLSQTEKCIAAMLTPVAVQGLNIPTPKVTVFNAPGSDHPPSPSIRSVTSMPNNKEQTQTRTDIAIIKAAKAQSLEQFHLCQ